jgi:hypothetical protein
MLAKVQLLCSFTKLRVRGREKVENYTALFRFKEANITWRHGLSALMLPLKKAAVIHRLSIFRRPGHKTMMR